VINLLINLRILLPNTLCCLIKFGLSVVLLASMSYAQSSSATDGSTPLGIAPGAPAGSYPLSGFENINLYNGNLNFHLPLLHVSGRGSAETGIMLALNSKRWRVRRVNQTCTNCQGYNYYPIPNWWNGIEPGYSPGVMQSRTVTTGPSCTGGSPPESAVTKLTFTGADGTEFELTDTLTHGLPQDVPNCTQGLSRGSTFTTTNGEAATFISCTPTGTLIPIYDLINTGINTVSGFLMLRDGTRYRIDSGKVSWLQDRNGNKITFTYDASFGRLIKVTDSLNREVNISYANFTNILYDTITYRGFGGTYRTLKIHYSDLASRLRSDFPDTLSYHDLFPTLDGSSSPYNPTDKVASVELPDGRSYQFQYNPYGELARVTLPTGGAIEYDYTTIGSSVVPEANDYNIYRRVTERRTYPNGGTGNTFEGKSTYTDSGFTIPPNTAASSVIENHLDSTGTVLAREKHYFYGDPRYFLGQPSWKDGRQYKTESIDANGNPILRRQESTWQQPLVTWCCASNQDLAPPNNPRIIETTTTLLDTNQIIKKSSVNPDTGAIGFDQYNNPTDVWEYHIGTTGTPGALVRQIHTDYLTIHPTNGQNYATNTNIHVRNLPVQQAIYDAAGEQKALTSYEYDNYTEGLTNRTNVTGLDSAYGQAKTTRGNVTQTTHWVLHTGAEISSRLQYDIVGNVISSTDPLGNTTSFEFNDRFGIPDNEAQSNISPSEVGNNFKTYAFTTKVTGPAPFNHTAYTQFDYYLGKPVNGEDANGVISSGAYDDDLDRATKLIVAVNHTDLKRQTSFDYDDSAKIITTTSDQTNYNDNAVKSASRYDGLGRAIETRNYVPGGGFIKSLHEFDAMGRIKRSYNPHQTTSEDTYGYIDSTYDELSRVKTVTTKDGSNTSTGIVMLDYTGNQTKITDQAGKKGRSIGDSMGRLVQVDELNTNDTVYASTTYSYDILDNLVKVTQGVQNRYFMYDSVKRLRRAFNPEQDVNTSIALSDPLTGNSQWNTAYLYDNNSNLTTKTDARNITTNYTYDELNRITLEDYSGTTPDVSYLYDNLPNAIGLLIKVSSSVSVTDYNEFDPLGRVKKSTQITDGQTYEMFYGYDRAGAMISQTYPSGRTVITGFDTAGRINALTGQKTGEANKTYASAFNYTSHSTIKQVTLGNTLIEQTSFNSRLQPVTIKLGSDTSPASQLQLTYTYNPTGQPALNNGNIVTQRIQSPGLDVTQNYTYDHLNRLTQAEENGGANWRQIYDIDRFGNRAVRNTSQMPYPNLTPQSANANDFSAFDQSTNRLKQVNGYEYDAAGNLTKDPETLTNAMVYDAQNRLISYTKNSAMTSYVYDGAGKRVKKIEPGNLTTLFVYNALGQLVAEYTSGNPTSNGTSYFTQDPLGSTRVVTKQDGTVRARYDYLPFGEEQFYARTGVAGYGGADTTKQKFTGKQRDNESRLDYFEARYHSGSQGRFTSVDPSNKSFILENPQTFNRYTYTLNNPLRYVDPDGQIPVETVIDVISFAHSFYEYWNNPTWANAGFLIWDGISIAVPYGPGSWVAKVGKEGYMGIKAVGVLEKFPLDKLETVVNNDYIRRGVALLSQGDDSTRKALGMVAKGGAKILAADFVGVNQGGKFIIGEAKGSDVGHAVEQIQSTVEAVLKNAPNAKIKTTEILLEVGQKVDGGYRVIGNQASGGRLQRYNTSSGQWDDVKVRVGNREKLVTVRYFQVPRRPLSSAKW
jgi:RHS repeat-associated protein